MSAALLAMLLLGAACWVLRSVFILLVPADRLPATMLLGLQHLAPAVLAALVVVELAGATADLTLWPSLLAVLAILLAAVAARRTGSLLLAVSIGLAAALVLDLLLV